MMPQEKDIAIDIPTAMAKPKLGSDEREMEQREA
jgi:hypothetical protein